MDLRLTIQGRVNPGILKSFGPHWAKKSLPIQPTAYKNEEWVFLDYSMATVPLNKEVAYAIERFGGRYSDNYTFKIIYCLDQFGNSLDSIPIGWKTISKIQFNPNTPASIGSLPLLSKWGYYPDKQITLLFNL